jgi:tRNA-splicing ligase RtcB (3'-phosphate/5'-hydroxy nucleic acid ligase)
MTEVTTKPIPIKGKHNEALAYAKAIEASCENKIRQYLDHSEFSGTKVRIMPDVHLGKSTVIGWTATYDSLIIPSFLGLDIGCGVCAINLEKGKLAFDKLDKFIRNNIPSGQSVRNAPHESLDGINAFVCSITGNTYFSTTDDFKIEIKKLCEKQKKNVDRVFASLGTLGGGNHFIEIDFDDCHNRWLLIHSGSRIFGANTAEYHEILALRETDANSPFKYLSGHYAEDYLSDVRLVQHYASVNRALIAQTIARGFFNVDSRETEYIDCAHNYIDPAEKIVRKGAISAKLGEKLVIPFSMSEGAVLGTGRGNPDWNYSAPHGSGRKKARTDAKSLSLDEYRKEMRGIWSSIICKDTLEESPMAYKKPKDVLDYIAGAVEVKQRLRPLYNFKAVD